MHSVLRLAVALVTSFAVIPSIPGQAQEEPQSRVPWARGPLKGQLGTEAGVDVPAQCLFTDGAGSKIFLDETENPSNGNERGTVLCPIVDAAGEVTGQWFVVFEFDASGYVKDDEKESLDADEILKGIQRGTEAANKERTKRGWSTFHVQGWQRPPYYDATTHNLTWAILGRSDDNVSLNHSVRLLGRRGVMSADLVVTPDHYEAALTEFNGLIGTFGYNQGDRYAEWREGDKIAKYGLVALVGGGAGALLVKSGLLQKFGKFLVVGAVAALAALKRLFGKKETSAT